jgi:hypothetical protein
MLDLKIELRLTQRETLDWLPLRMVAMEDFENGQLR